MYVGDNDAHNFPLTVPAGNANEEFASNRIWRNTGIAENSSTNIGSQHRRLGVGRDPDPGPVPLARAKRRQARSSRPTCRPSPTTRGCSTRDACAIPNHPPASPAPWAASPTTPRAARRSSPAARCSGPTASPANPTNESSRRPTTSSPTWGSSRTPPTKSSTSTRPARTGPPTAASRSPRTRPKPTRPLTFDASGLPRPRRHDRQIRMGPRRQRQLRDEHAAAKPRRHPQLLRRGRIHRAPAGHRQRRRHRHGRAHADHHQQPAADGQLHHLTHLRRRKGEPISFNASGSKDPDGTIAKYEWDFDGNGTYETNGGSNPRHLAQLQRPPAPTRSACGSPTTAARRATTTRSVSVNSGEVSKYSDSVLATAGLVHYWRMGETSRQHLRRQRRLQPRDHLRRTDSRRPRRRQQRPRPSGGIRRQSTTPPKPRSTSRAPTR